MRSKKFVNLLFEFNISGFTDTKNNLDTILWIENHIFFTCYKTMSFVNGAIT